MNTLTICHHPLMQHQLSIMRDKNTAHENFRLALQKVTQFVLYQATQNLLLVKKNIETPIAMMESETLSPDIPIIVIPILRAGLMMSEVMMEFIPQASIFHLGIYRDEKTLQPITYYNKLPNQFPSHAQIFILDPMLATGGSLHAAIEIILHRGAREHQITVASLIGAPEGIHHIQQSFPAIKIIVAAIDSHLNEQAYIVPGLGDAGDRAFGTDIRNKLGEKHHATRDDISQKSQALAG